MSRRSVSRLLPSPGLLTVCPRRVILSLIVGALLALSSWQPAPVHAGAQLWLYRYNGNGDYLIVYGSYFTRYADSRLMASLPPPNVKTICDQLHVNLWAKVLGELPETKWLPLASSVACNGYKVYMLRDWVMVYYDIHQAALNGGCAIFIWSSGTWSRGPRIHPAHDYVTGKEIAFLPYGYYTYVKTTPDRLLQTPWWKVTCGSYFV